MILKREVPPERLHGVWGERPTAVGEGMVNCRTNSAPILPFPLSTSLNSCPWCYRWHLFGISPVYRYCDRLRRQTE
ncbi:hypothetical protein [Calothrix sp. PCC 6303]|uniref:hypothetical protein n=1 Tax=Calothrix sp. PCC 6303 TaxID=1170562 RepID=UPI0002D822E2|nr:hypothetical protein [Calothrix sp. PCC 6303]